MTTHPYNASLDESQAFANGARVLRVPVPEQPEYRPASCGWLVGKRFITDDIGGNTPWHLAEKLLALCPYKPGDIILVREPWACCKLIQDPTGEYVSRQVDCFDKADVESRCLHMAYEAEGQDSFEGNWQPASTIPDWAIRTRLRVKSVRVEQISAITLISRLLEMGTTWDMGSDRELVQEINKYEAHWNARLHDGTPYGETEYAFDRNPWTYVIELEQENK
jgi:hypothetical protein